LPAHATVVDLVYRPRETTVLARARERGLRAVDGLGMLLHQGALAFELWTHLPAPLEVMRAALELP
jgi:shikimate dehydrogenase